MQQPDIGLQLARAALGCIGTPFYHGGRVKGVGLDCVGLLVICGRECGLDIEDQPFYSAQDDNFELLRPALEEHCSKVFGGEYQLGDVLLFRRTGGPRPIFNHVGVVTDAGRSQKPSFVHAWSTPSIMAVVETPMDDYWWRSIAGVFRWRNG